MKYTARDLGRNTKEILDKALINPVTIRRGGEFFEIYRLQMVGSREKNFVAQAQDSTVIEDSQEWEEPVNQYTPNKPTLDDLFKSGGIQRGIK